MSKNIAAITRFSGIVFDHGYPFFLLLGKDGDENPVTLAIEPGAVKSLRASLAQLPALGPAAREEVE